MKRVRYSLLDTWRGMTLISMILYHGMFDLTSWYGNRAVWFREWPGYVWQQSICWTFILLSGFCWSLGKKPGRRGLLVFSCGWLVTAVTWVCTPDVKILFGILTFTGTAMLVMLPLKTWLDRIPPCFLLAGSAGLFFLTRNVNAGSWGFEKLVLGAVPKAWYQNLATAFLGFPSPDFYSGDYFSFIPWFFLYLTGYALYQLVKEQEWIMKRLQTKAGVLAWIGRHSLQVYLLHQPALMLVLTAAEQLHIL